VGINGFGRIGRNFFRAVSASGADIDLVAANDLGDLATMAHLLKYDSILGPFPGAVEVDDEGISVDGTKVKILAERDPASLGWGDLGVDMRVAKGSVVLVVVRARVERREGEDRTKEIGGCCVVR